MRSAESPFIKRDRSVIESVRREPSQNLQICCNFRNLPCAFIVGSMTAPFADKYYSISPYVFCNNNPVNFVDPFGMDWYSTIEEVEDENGKKSQETRYYWTKAKSQKEMYGLGIEGAYLGEAVVVFNGYYGEKLGKDGTLTGEGAKAASVNIYGTNGPDDIKSYHGLSVSSNPDKYPMLIDGREWKNVERQLGKSKNIYLKLTRK